MQGLIDRASAYEVIPVVSGDCADLPWATQPAIATTHALIHTPHLRMAPDPAVQRSATGPWATLVSHLSELTGPVQDGGAELAPAMTRARQWAAAPGQLLRAAEQAESDSSFEAWRNWHVVHEWCEHAARMGGLFDWHFAKQIAAALSISVEDLADLHERSGEAHAVQMAAERERAGRGQSEDFAIIGEAWLLSTLIRGRLHGAVAQRRHEQLLQHPIRAITTHTLVRGPPLVRRPSDAEEAFSRIVLFGSGVDRNLRDRLEQYGTNVTTARRASMHGDLRLNADGAAKRDTAIEQAIDEARRLGLRLHSKRAERAAEVFFGLGTAAVTSFVLHPFEAVAAGAAMVAYEAFRPKRRSIEQSLALRRSRLRRLASGPSGVLSITSA